MYYLLVRTYGKVRYDKIQIHIGVPPSIHAMHCCALAVHPAIVSAALGQVRSSALEGCPTNAKVRCSSSRNTVSIYRVLHTTNLADPLGVVLVAQFALSCCGIACACRSSGTVCSRTMPSTPSFFVTVQQYDAVRSQRIVFACGE